MSLKHAQKICTPESESLAHLSLDTVSLSLLNINKHIKKVQFKYSLVVFRWQSFYTTNKN